MLRKTHTVSRGRMTSFPTFLQSTLRGLAVFQELVNRWNLVSFVSSLPLPFFFLSLLSFFPPFYVCVCIFPPFCSLPAFFIISKESWFFFSVRVVSKLLLIFYKETIFWNTSYTIFLHFSLLLKCWQCVGCEHGGIVAFECCKVNAENDSLNGIIKVDVGNIWMPPSLLCGARPWFLVLLPCTFSENLTAYHFLLSPHF